MVGYKRLLLVSTVSGAVFGVRESAGGKVVARGLGHPLFQCCANLFILRLPRYSSG